MRILLDLLLLLIVALSIWDGYKRGLIGGVFGILALVVALIAGNSLSSMRDNVLEIMGYGSTDLSLEDVLESDSSLRYDYAVICMEELGFQDSRAETLAQRAVRYSEANDVSMTDAVITILCDTVTYVVGLALCFLLVVILLSAIGNIGNLVFRLPDSMELLDELGGAILGFVRGFLYCVLLCWLLSFLGLVIGKDTLENTLLARFFLTFQFLTSGLL